MRTDGGGGGAGITATGSGGSFADGPTPDLPGETSDPRKPNGVVCGNAMDCVSGFCVDGVCCDSTCQGTCRSCALQGTVGICRAVDVGSDPADECLDQGAASCGTDGTCDGAGGCRKYPEGTMCAAPGCSASMMTMAGSCNATGMCQKAAGTSCGTFACGGTACRTTCTLPAHCTAPSVCNLTACGGLVGTYYNTENFMTPVLTRTDPTIDFNWGTGNPDSPLVGADTFSIQWRGKLTPKFTGMYTFYLLGDDGVKLTINNTVVINALPNPTPAVEKSGMPVALQANQAVPILLEYTEGVGNAQVHLSWSNPSEPTKVVIPTSALSP